MSKYAMTFGVKYAYIEHPIGDWVDPMGYVEIEANGNAEARDLAFKTFGKNWAFLYDSAEINDWFLPLGKIAELDKNGLRVLEKE